MNDFNLNHLLSQSFDFPDMLKHTFSIEQITHTQIYTGMERFFFFPTIKDLLSHQSVFYYQIL